MRKYVGFLSIAIFIGSLFASTSASAAPVVGFDPANIIDDKTLTNYQSMTVSEIQNFLNSKVSACDTQGALSYTYRYNSSTGAIGRFASTSDPYVTTTRAIYGQRYNTYTGTQDMATPFTCLKDYQVSDGRSAAQVIYDVAQQRRINPQVLIVLLQKEQGLITDDWPIPLQYKTAAGYGCPDTAPCDSQYFGLINQLDWAAKLFRSVLDQDPNWYSPYVIGSNYIQWSPNSNCGGTVVTIQNWATVALYNYTPYQPNAAALAAGYGTGDACSAYGNRNFYLYFNEWFGGYLINAVDTGNLYIRGVNGTYYQITTYAQLQGLGIVGLKTYNTVSAYLDNLTNAGPLTPAVQVNSLGDVYAIDSNRLHYFSAASYNAYGSPAISNLAAGLDSGIIPRGADMTTVLSEHNVGDLFFMQAGKRHHIAGGSVYNNEGYASIPITWMSKYYVNSIPKGAPILSAGTFIETTDTKQASVINTDRASKRPLAAQSLASIARTPYRDTSVVLDQIPSTTESAISILIKDSVGNLYITDGDKKIALSSGLLTSINKTAADFTTVDATYLNQFTTVSPGGNTFLFWLDNGARVYRVENGEMVAIINQDDFNRLGYSFANVIRLRSNTVAQLFTNTDRIALPAASLFKLPGTGRVYILDDQNIGHLIPTGDVFNDFNFSWSSVRDINNTTLNYYTSSPSLSLSSLVTTPDGNRWLVSKGRHYGLPTQLSLSYDPTETAYTRASYVSLDYGIRSRDASKFIRVNNDARVYYVDAGIKYPLGSVSAFESRGGTSWDMVISISESTANLFPTGSILY